jgi:hypothetical protein
MKDARARIEVVLSVVHKRNPGEAEFHQAVRAVVETLTPAANVALCSLAASPLG